MAHPVGMYARLVKVRLCLFCYIPVIKLSKFHLTLARTRCFSTFARAGGGGVGATPPGDRPLMVVELLGKKQSMRLDEISRLHIFFLVIG